MGRILFILLMPFSVYSMDFKSINSAHYEQTWLSLLNSERPASPNITNVSQNSMPSIEQTPILPVNQELLIEQQRQEDNSLLEAKAILAIIVNQKNVKDKSFPCQYSGCAKAYSGARSRLKHIKKVHEQDPKLICEKCEFVAGYPGDLDKHKAACDKRMPGLKRIIKKPQDKPFPCTAPGCSRRFEYEKTRDVHRAAKHSDNPKFKCSACSYSSISDANIKVHEESCLRNILAGSNIGKTATALPYPCLIDGCDKSFKYAASRRTHRRVDHELRYVCSLCGQKLASPAMLRTHEKKHKI